MSATLSAASARVHRLTFDLALSARTQAVPLQDCISAFCRLHLEDALTLGLRALPAGMESLVLERVELQLGELDAGAPERGLERKIGEALALALARLAPPSGDPLWPGAHLLAEFFDADPALPRDQGDAAMRSALATSPAALERALQVTGGSERNRRRLAAGLSPPVIVVLVRLLARGDADIVIRYVGDLVSVHGLRPVLPEPRGEFEAVLWEFVFAYLLLERGSYFNTRSFASATLERLAQRYRVTYQVLLERLVESVIGLRLPASARYSLPAVLADLHADLMQGIHASVAPAATSADEHLRNLEAFLERGLLPASAVHGASATQSIAHLLDRWPEQLCALIRRVGVRETPRRRLLDAAAPPLLERIVCQLEPAHGAQINAHLATLRRLQAQRAVVPQDGPAYARSLWQFVLTYVLVERGSWFNTRSFVRSLLLQMAARHRISYRVLLLDLIAQALPAVQHASLHAVLRWLADEELMGIGLSPCVALPEAPSDSIPSMLGATHISRLERLLTIGPRPAPMRGDPIPDAALAQWLQRFSDADICAVLHGHGKRQAVLERVSWQFGAAFRERTLAALAGTQAGAVAVLRQTLHMRLDTLRLERHHVDFYLLAWLAGRTSEPFKLSAMVSDVVQALAVRLGRTAQELAPPTLLLRVLPSDTQQLAAGQPQESVQLLVRLRAVAADPAAMTHLLAELPRAHLMRLMRQVAPASSGFFSTLLLAAAVLSGSTDLNAAQRRQTAGIHLHQVALLLLGGDWQAWSTQRMLSVISRASARELGLEYGRYLRLMQQAVATRGQHQPRYEPLLDMIEREAAQQAVTATPSRSAASANESRPPAQSLPVQPLAADATFYIENAGAVLLWPFLDRYYRTLDLLEDRQFRDDACRSRAVRLLQFLISGDENPPEHAMLLNKIMCGVDETVPLEWGCAPTHAERKLSHQLLYGVTQAWSMLQNTQIDTLQQSFLQRGGALRRKNDDWKLNVEKGPYDMLLQSLPWGLSTLRLSWMRTVLWVKWT